MAPLTIVVELILHAFLKVQSSTAFIYHFKFPKHLLSQWGTHNIHCVSVHRTPQQLNPFLQSLNAQTTHAAAVDMYSAQQPNVLQCVCKSAGSWRASPNCLVIGRELNGGDGLWCWCIYLLRHWEEAPPMFWLTGRRPASLCLTRPGWRKVCLLTRWDVHEDDRKTFH